MKVNDFLSRERKQIRITIVFVRKYKLSMHANNFKLQLMMKILVNKVGVLNL